MTDAQKNWIDDATYEQLLRRWRCASSGDPMFAGDTGDYYAQRIIEKRAEAGVKASAAASQRDRQSDRRSVRVRP